MDTSLIYNPKSIYLDENININTFFEENYMKQNLFYYDLNLKAKEFLNIFNKISFYIHSLYVERKNFLEFKNYLKFLEHISKYSNSTAKLHESYWKINKIIKDRNISNYSDLDQMLGIAQKDINTNADHIILFFNTSMFSSDRIHSNYNFLQEQIELLEVPLKNDKDINNKLKDIYDDCKNSDHFSKLQRDLEGLEGYLRLRFDMPFLYVQVLYILDLLANNTFKNISELLNILNITPFKNNFFTNLPSYYLSIYEVKNPNLVIQKDYNNLTKSIRYNLATKENFGELISLLEELDSRIKGVILNDKLVVAIKFFINEVLLGKLNNYSLLKDFLLKVNNEYSKDNMKFFEIEEPYIRFKESKNLIGSLQGNDLYKLDSQLKGYTNSILKFKIPKNKRQNEINNYYNSISKEKMKIIDSKYNNFISQIKKIEYISFSGLNLEKDIYNLTKQSKICTYEEMQNILDSYYKINIKYLIRSMSHNKYSSNIIKIFSKKYGLVAKSTGFSSFLQNVDINSLRKIEETLYVSSTYEEFYSLLSVIK